MQTLGALDIVLVVSYNNTRTILTHAHRASLIDGLGRPAGQVVHYSTVVAISHRGLRPASCVIVSGFRAALDYYISP